MEPSPVPVGSSEQEERAIRDNDAALVIEEEKKMIGSYLPSGHLYNANSSGVRKGSSHTPEAIAKIVAKAKTRDPSTYATPEKLSAAGLLKEKPDEETKTKMSESGVSVRKDPWVHDIVKDDVPVATCVTQAKVAVYFGCSTDAVRQLFKKEKGHDSTLEYHGCTIRRRKSSDHPVTGSNDDPYVNK